MDAKMACLVPPGRRTKSRLMNLAELVSWGRKMLNLIDDPSALEGLGVSAERVRAKPGRLEDYRAPPACGSEYHELIGATLKGVRDHGLFVGALQELESDPSKSGFTGWVLSLGAMVSSRTTETIREALEKCPVRAVGAWCEEKLGPSIQSQRKQAFPVREGATETG